MDQLKLVALDGEDLAIISAHLQDAVVKAGEMAFLPREKRFALLLNRFDWTATEPGVAGVRRRAGLHFERVLGAQLRGLSIEDKDAVLNLLAITFEETEAPSGTLVLAFSGGAAIRLQVECIEAAMSDLGPAWGAKARPSHDPA